MSNSELEQLIAKSSPRIRGAALVLTGRPWEADDLAQETFLQALEGWSRFAGNGRVERSDLNQRLDELKGQVDALKTEVSKLTRVLEQLEKKLRQ